MVDVINMSKRVAPSNSTDKKVPFSNDPQPIPKDTPVQDTNPRVIKKGAS